MGELMILGGLAALASVAAYLIGRRTRPEAPAAAPPAPPAPLPPVNVRALVPAFSAAKATDASAGTLRLAFRAWIMFQIEAGGALPIGDIASGPHSDAQREAYASELYARAIMESAAASHLDGLNPRTDRLVLAQLANLFGAAFAVHVHASVAARGLVFEDALPARAREDARG